MTFALDSSTRRELGYFLIDAINNYFESLKQRDIQLPLERRPVRKGLKVMPEEGDAPAKVLDEVFSEFLESGFHLASANYTGLPNPTPTYVSILGDALVSAMNPQLSSLARSLLGTEIERETIGWLCQRLNWNPSGGGTFTTGGTEANLSALAVALTAKHRNWVKEGLRSLPAHPVFYTSSEAHHSVDKSASLLGLGRQALRRIPVDSQCRMLLSALEKNIEEDLALGNDPFCVVSTAGTPSAGAIDDLELISEVCRRYGLWHHVDGAYGGALIMSNEYRHLLHGIESSDSVAVDPHKWLAMPFSCSALLTVHPELLEDTFDVPAPYLYHSTGALDNYKIGLQWSRRMNSFKLWLTLRVHGRNAYEEVLGRQLRLARQFSQWVEGSKYFELAAPQVLPIVNFRLKLEADDEDRIAPVHARLVKDVIADGKFWISSTFSNNRNVIRMMIISYLTEQQHLDELAERLKAAAERILACNQSQVMMAG